jgi:hypothetical protein
MRERDESGVCGWEVFGYYPKHGYMEGIFISIRVLLLL